MSYNCVRIDNDAVNAAKIVGYKTVVINTVQEQHNEVTNVPTPAVQVYNNMCLDQKRKHNYKS